LCTSSRSS